MTSRPSRESRHLSPEGFGPNVSWLLRPTEVATVLGLGRSKVFQMLAAGELPTIRIGRCVRIPRSGLEAWLAERTSPGSQPRPPASSHTGPVDFPECRCSLTRGGPFGPASN
jgi:excisionase family DNA binding protein